MTNPTTAAPEQQAELILAAWLERNPVPSRRDGASRTVSDAYCNWRDTKADLIAMLAFGTDGACLGAVIQFLLPEGWGWSLEVERPTVSPLASVSPPGHEPWGPGSYFNSDGDTPALALLAAILAAQTVDSP
jgi:hypothetical protein